jgi:hypothetical protein
MVPQMIFSNVSWLNLKDYDWTFNISPENDKQFHATTERENLEDFKFSMKSWIPRLRNRFGFFNRFSDSMASQISSNVSGLNLIDIAFTGVLIILAQKMT